MDVSDLWKALFCCAILGFVRSRGLLRFGAILSGCTVGFTGQSALRQVI